MAKFECNSCGYIFDERQAGITFSNIMECPICAGSRDDFKRLDEEEESKAEPEKKTEEEPAAEAMEASGSEKNEGIESEKNEGAESEEKEKPATGEKEDTEDSAKDPGGDEKQEDSSGGFVIEKRQEFWLDEKAREDEDREVDRSNIETFYGDTKPVKTQEELDKEAKQREEENRPKLDPIDGSGSVQTVIDGGDRSPNGSDPEVVVVEENEATSDVDEGDDEFIFVEEEIESDVPLETEEIPPAVSAGITEEGDFFTGFDSNPNYGESVRTEEFFFDDEEPVGEAVELTEEAVETPEEAAEEETAEAAEEIVEEVTETVEEVAEDATETAEEEAVEISEEATEEVVEEAAEDAEDILTEFFDDDYDAYDDNLIEDVVLEQSLLDELLAGKVFGIFNEEDEEEEDEILKEMSEFFLQDDDEDTLSDETPADDEVPAEEAFSASEESPAEEAFSAGEEVTAEEDTAADEVLTGTSMVEDKAGTLLADEQARNFYEQYAPGGVQNGLEEIILLPAQFDPMPFDADEEIQSETVLGKRATFPANLHQPFASRDSIFWGEFIPGEIHGEDYLKADLVLVKGKHGHIPNVSGKEELRKEIAKAKGFSGGKPVGVSLIIGRIEQDLATLVYADADFVVLNDASSGMLPYALRRAKNYLSRVNSRMEIYVNIEDVNDTREIAKLIALGADCILLAREYGDDRIRIMRKELIDLARSTGHGSVHEFNMYDICTISADLAANTDISHF